MEAMEVTEVTAMVTVLMDMEAIIEVCMLFLGGLFSFLAA